MTNLLLLRDSLQDFDGNTLNTWGVFPVITYKLDHLLAAVAKLAKRAAKLGCEAPTVVVGETFKQQVSKKELVERTYVHVRGPRPAFNGWELAATLQNMEGQVIVRSVPGIEVPGLTERDPAACEHCNVDRMRTDTFMVRHEDGTLKQVGRQCLADFLGHADPVAFASWAQFSDVLSAALEDACDDGEGGGGRRIRFFALDVFLSYAAWCIRKLGWVSRAMARDFYQKVATADDAVSAMFPPKDLPEGQRVYPEAQDQDEAAAAIAWATDLDTTGSDYLHNLKVYATAGVVDFRGIGIAASMIIAHHNALQKAVNRQDAERDLKPAAARVCIGELGARLTLKVKALYPPRSIDTDYGAMHIFNLATEGGDSCVWFASNKPEWLKVGEWVEVKATVKKHGTYQPREGDAYKQTSLSRVALPPAPKPPKVKKTKAAAEAARGES